MEDIFLKVLNMSITAGWFLLAVLCIRLVFRRIPKWINCLLWGAAAIRLVCPFSIESGLSVLPSTELVKTSAVVDGRVQNYIPSIDSHLTIVKNTINPILAENFAYDEAASVAPLQVVTYITAIVWVCGMIVLLFCAMGSTLRLHKLVEEAVCVRNRIYICDAVTSPFILGIVRPRVYLPSAVSEMEMNYIIAHEAAHLKRKDYWWKPLGYLLLCIHWFNPLCWAAYAMFCKDMELACDEKAAKSMTLQEKKEYSKVLLSCTGQKRLVMVCPLAFGEVGVKERVKSVLYYKKPALWVVIAAAIAILTAAVCFLTNPTQEYQSSMSEQKPNEEVAAQEDGFEKSVSFREEAAAGEVSNPNMVLYEHPQADKVCIEVQPCIIRENSSYYYIPVGEDQNWLTRQVKALDLKGESWSGRREGHRETGWEIVYNDIVLMGLEGGYLYYTYADDETGIMECLIEAPKLCEQIQSMVTEKAGYQNYDISNIKDIVSAKLDVNCIFTGSRFYSQTVTDVEILQKFEEWFCNAEYIFGGTECANQLSCLELTLANGDVVKLSMATDSCPNFSIDGVAYDYRPASDWDNSEFYKCFDEIPWEV